MKFSLLTLIVINLHQLTNGRLLTTPDLNFRSYISAQTFNNTGEPLVLTKFIQENDMVNARKLSEVDSKYFLNIKSFSGYLTVNEKFNSNLFFWFFPAEGTEYLYEDDDDIDNDNDNESNNRTIKSISHGDHQTPVILWLQGGPGSSSLFALFTENGPFFIADDLITLKKNPNSWHTKYSILYVDNPVGTGFSYTAPNGGYCENIPRVAKELYIGIEQFFQLFPMLQKNPFFIIGESFAGKYIPAIGNEIFERNQDKKFIINLQGLALGNALSDPYNMMEYGDFVYQAGLVDDHGLRDMKIFQNLILKHYPSTEAHAYWDATLFTFLKHSNYSNLYNILVPELPDFKLFVKFINLPEIRKAIHVGNEEFSSETLVYMNLIPDFLTTAMHWTEKLLNHDLRIMYYSGNMDLIVAYPLSENAYKHMKWNGSDKYRYAQRKSFYVNDKLKGYVKKVDNFYDVVMLNAGHMVPTDQPEATLELIDQFIYNKL